MVVKVLKYIVLLTVAYLLLTLGWGLYYNTSRPWIEEKMGYNYNFLLLLVAVEYGPLLLSIIAGVISDLLGRVKIIALGLFQSIAFALIPFLGLMYLPIVILLASFFSIFPWMNIIALTMIIGRKSGKVYAYIALGGSLGWGLSGIITMALNYLCHNFEFVLISTYASSSIFLFVSTLLTIIVAKSYEDFRRLELINIKILKNYFTNKLRLLISIIASFTLALLRNINSVECLSS
mgnify:CR=1 FL=1